MRDSHYAAVLALCAVALLSCSGGDNGPSGPSDPGQPDTPHAESVTVTMDPSRMASARIPTTGGLGSGNQSGWHGLYPDHSS